MRLASRTGVPWVGKPGNSNDEADLGNTTFLSLVAQMVNNLPAMWKTQIQSLGLKDSLEKKLATYSSILAWRIPSKNPFEGISWWSGG